MRKKLKVFLKTRKTSTNKVNVFKCVVFDDIVDHIYVSQSKAIGDVSIII